MSITVFLIDDDPGCRETLGPFLETMGYAVCLAASLPEARALSATRSIDIALVDLRLVGAIDSVANGLVALADTALGIIVLAGRGNRPAAIAAVRSGALDFIEKPFDFDSVAISVRRAVELTTLRSEVAQLRAATPTPSFASEAISELDSPPRPSAPLGAFQSGSLAEVESRAIADALRRTNGNKLRAAKLLGIARSTLLEKLKRQQVI